MAEETLNRRFSQISSPEVWTDGTRHVVLYRDRSIACYEGNTLLWFHPAPREPATGILGSVARFGSYARWPRGAVDSAGRFALVDLAGFDVLSLLSGNERTEAGPNTRLGASPKGVVLADPDTRSLRCLDDGTEVSVPGAGPLLRGARGSRCLYASTGTTSGGVLMRIEESGQVSASVEIGYPNPPWLASGALMVLHCEGGSWLVEAFDPVTLTPLGRRSHPLPAPGGICVADVSGNTLVASDGHSAWLFDPGRERPHRTATLPPPSGDPQALAGPPSLETRWASWSGDRGLFEIQSSLVNRGRTVRETTWTVRGRDNVQMVIVGDSFARFDAGVAVLSCEMPLDTRLPLSIRGQADASCTLDLDVSVEGMPMGSLSLPLRVAQSPPAPLAPAPPAPKLRCERDGEALTFEPSWLQDLQQSGALRWDPAPDLGRWKARAETRAAREGGDPERVREIFLELSRDERSREPPQGALYRYKFEPGGPWILGEREARTITVLLGKAHPLGAFAARGALEISGELPA